MLPLLWGVNVGAVPVGGGRQLGWPGERSVTLGGRTLGLLLEADVEKPLRLVQALVVLWVRHVGDVLQPAGGGRHVVGRTGKVQAARSPCAGVMVTA